MRKNFVDTERNKTAEIYLNCLKIKIRIFDFLLSENLKNLRKNLH